MADWKKLLKEVLLADGIIDTDETMLIKKELVADGIVDEEEMQFLVDLRVHAKDTCAEFTAFFFEALTATILEDGVIDSAETDKLRKIVFADGVIDADEKMFLAGLKKNAQQLCPEFEALFSECMAV